MLVTSVEPANQARGNGSGDARRSNDTFERFSDPRVLYFDLLRRSVLGITYRAFGGTEKFDNLQASIEMCLSEDVPGDLMEAGCWRGGVTIFMRAAERVPGR